MKLGQVARLLAVLGAGVLMAGGCRTILGIDEPIDYDECVADDGNDCDAGEAGAPADGGSGGTVGTGGNLGTGGDAGNGAALGTGGVGGTGGDTAAAGAAGAGGTPTLGEVGEPCGEEGAFGCEGHDTRVQLVCSDGEWERTGSCGSTERCDTRASEAGLCNPVVDECIGESAGFSFCRGDERFECGVDLVTAQSEEECEHTCIAGACTECTPESIRCSDGATETCTEDGGWGDPVSCPSDTPVCGDTHCEPPSCEGLPANCGADGDESCCETLTVPGSAGEYFRQYDTNTTSFRATMSGFRLDKFEVTVGRFRNFREAWIAGWRPQVGDGKHSHLNSGSGVGDTWRSTYEIGWEASSVDDVDLSNSALIACLLDPDDPNTTPDDANAVTWTSEPADNENHPVNCVNWHEARAFCIWDEGFLPTESEWHYAAVGGEQQRYYAWSDPSTSQEVDSSLAVYDQPDVGPAPVGSKPDGDGRWGQADLTGNVWEWVLDRGADYNPSDVCNDCAALPNETAPDSNSDRPLGYRINRGGAFDQNEPAAAWARTSGPSLARASFLGFRCARVP